MTINIETRSISYDGDGATVNYIYPFKIFEDNDLTVIVTDSSGTNSTLTLNIDYTVNDAGESDGSIDLTAASLCATGEEIHLISNVEGTQDTDFTDGENFSQEAVESGLDKVAIVSLQNKEKISRSLHFPVGDTTSSELPSAGSRSGLLLGFNSSGEISLTQSSAIDYSGEIYENYDSLKAVSTGSLADKTPAIVQFKSTKGDGDGGFFYWDTSDLSVEVTADATEENYVPPSTDTTGASGAWVRQSTNSETLYAANVQSILNAADYAAIRTLLSLVPDTNFYAKSTIDTMLTGFVGFFPTATAPTGWIKANGAAVSRTTYSSLFAVIGVTYGNGDGSTTFNLPDLRGKFPRFFDNGAGNDPDAASRTDRGDGTVGDYVGTNQADEIKEHLHTYDFAATSSGVSIYPLSAYNQTAGARSTNSTGGNETRPINIALLGCIKY